MIAPPSSVGPIHEEQKEEEESTRPRRRRKGGKKPFQEKSLREDGCNVNMRFSRRDYAYLEQLAEHLGFGTNKTATMRSLLYEKCRAVGIMPWPGRKPPLEQFASHNRRKDTYPS